MPVFTVNDPSGITSSKQFILRVLHVLKGRMIIAPDVSPGFGSNNIVLSPIGTTDKDICYLRFSIVLTGLQICCILFIPGFSSRATFGSPYRTYINKQCKPREEGVLTFIDIYSKNDVLDWKALGYTQEEAESLSEES